MSATDQMFFRSKIMRYKNSYDQDRDVVRYTTNNVSAGIALIMAEKNEYLKRMGKVGLVLPTALSLSSPLFMGAIDSVAHQISCPVDERMSALEFIQHFGERIGDRYDSEYAEPTRKALKAVRDALHSIGL